jgi:hypothetical protein
MAAVIAAADSRISALEGECIAYRNAAPQFVLNWSANTGKMKTRQADVPHKLPRLDLSRHQKCVSFEETTDARRIEAVGATYSSVIRPDSGGVLTARVREVALNLNYFNSSSCTL